MATPQTLITLLEASLAYGHHALLDKVNLTVQAGERIGLIGRNGAGKSSLLKVLDGRADTDSGEVAMMKGIRTITVEQEPDLDPDSTVQETIEGEYIESEDWGRVSRAASMITQLNLDPEAKIAGLSGGTKKRIAIARALVQEPDLLMLDEPTNHLDFDGIQWLTDVIKRSSASVIVITHDRRFLDDIASRIIELDRGKLLSFPGNFSHWQQKKAEWLAAEKLENERFDKLLAQEEVWIRKGIEARRTRNEGRVRRLESLRVQRQARRENPGSVNFALDKGENSGKVVAEIRNISHQFGDKKIVDQYSSKILRGDRIGLIGPNGAGKTTLLKIILGELKPDSGSVKLGTNLNIAYFDQMRDQLDEEAILTEVINPGSEWVEIGKERKHVMSYLGDFLFSPERAKSPVKSLSGGERARLLMARLFARPANVLVMDEPTNDLDVETLELLEQLLQDFEGTVLLVSHDRAFLDNVITQTIAYEGNGKWHDYVGGYDDWLRQRQAAEAAKPTATPAEKPKPQPKAENKPAEPKNKSNRISPWELKELEALPEKINELEQLQQSLGEQMSDPDLYADGPEKAQEIQEKIQQVEEQLATLFDRWEVLEQKKAN